MGSDLKPIEIACPNCGAKIEHQFGRLEEENGATCGECGVGLNFDEAEAVLKKALEDAARGVSKTVRKRIKF